MDELTLAGHIRAGVAAHDGCPLEFVAGDREQATTLGGLVSDAERVAAALQARGIGPRESRRGAAARAPTRESVVLTAVGYVRRGPAAGSDDLRPAKWTSCCSESGVWGFFLPSEYRGRPHATLTCSAGWPGGGGLKFAVVVGGELTPGHGGALGYAGLLRQPGGSYRARTPTLMTAPC